MTIRHFVIPTIIGVLMAGVLLSGPARGATPADYQRAITSISSRLQLVEQMERNRAGSASQLLTDALKSLPDSMSIDYGNGMRVNADFQWIKKQLAGIGKLTGRTRAEQVGELYQRVEMLAAAIADVPINSPSSIKHARTVLKDVLARNEYRESPINQWIARAVAATFRAISHVLDMIPKGALNFTGWVVLIVAILAFAGLLILLVMKLFPFGPGTPLTDRAAAVEHSPKPKRQSVEELLQKSEEAAAAGRYQDAFRLIYLASLFLFDKAGIIRYDESGTNWEYMRAVARQAGPENSEAFRNMTTLFDRTVYGHHPFSESDYQIGRQAYRKLEAIS